MLRTANSGRGHIREEAETKEKESKVEIYYIRTSYKQEKEERVVEWTDDSSEAHFPCFNLSFHFSRFSRGVDRMSEIVGGEREKEGMERSIFGEGENTLRATEKKYKYKYI